MKKWIFIALAALLVIVGCTKKETAPKPVKNEAIYFAEENEGILVSYVLSGTDDVLEKIETVTYVDLAVFDDDEKEAFISAAKDTEDIMSDIEGVKYEYSVRDEETVLYENVVFDIKDKDAIKSFEDNNMLLLEKDSFDTISFSKTAKELETYGMEEVQEVQTL